MPWNRTDWMSERVKFIAAYLEYEARFTDLCRDFGVSRKTGYKWVRRYEANGAAALEDHSRAPHCHPNAVPAHIDRTVLTTPASPLATTQAAGHPEAAAATDGASCREHHRRPPQAERAGSSATPHPAQLAVRRSAAAVRCARRGLVCRLQRMLPDWRPAWRRQWLVLFDLSTTPASIRRRGGPLGRHRGPPREGVVVGRIR